MIHCIESYCPYVGKRCPKDCPGTSCWLYQATLKMVAQGRPLRGLRACGGHHPTRKRANAHQRAS